MRLPAFTTMIACLVMTTAPICVAQDTVTSLIPIGDVDAEVMELVFPARQQELFAKMQEAIRKNDEWWWEYAKRHSGRGPLPYHSKLGLSESEYAEMQSMQNEMTVRQAGNGLFRVVASSDGVFTFESDGRLAPLNGIELDVPKDEVRTPLGTASERFPIDAPAESALGRWSGMEWKQGVPNVLEADLSEISGTRISFCLGRRSSGGGVLFYDVTKFDSGVKTARIMIILYYPLADDE